MEQENVFWKIRCSSSTPPGSRSGPLAAKNVRAWDFHVVAA